MERQEAYNEVEEYYSDMYNDIRPGATVHYFKRKTDPFEKSRGSTLSEPVVITGRHKCNFATDKSTRSSPIKKCWIGVSFGISGDVQRYLPYKFDLSTRSKNKKSKNQESILLV